VQASCSTLQHAYVTSRVIPVSSKMRFGTGGRVEPQFEDLARYRGRGLTNVCKAVCTCVSWPFEPTPPSMTARQLSFPNTSTATSMILHHFEDSPVVSTSTTAHSMSCKSVASLTARVETCKAEGTETAAGCCLLRMYNFSASKLLPCDHVCPSCEQ
jgi:hypothetical protein